VGNAQNYFFPNHSAVSFNRSSTLHHGQNPSASFAFWGAGGRGRTTSAMVQTVKLAEIILVTMEIRRGKNKMSVDGKVATELDCFVLDCAGIIEKTTPYVIVSGYVAIFFGRARGTEDIDMLIPRIKKDEFMKMHKNLAKEGYYFLNPEDAEGLYDMLANDKLGIRIAKKNTIIPNMEMKFVKDGFDDFSLRNRQEVVFGKNRVYLAPFEIQIPYKIRLSSEKDIEDAVYLWEISKDFIDRKAVAAFFRELKVRGDKYGIEV